MTTHSLKQEQASHAKGKPATDRFVPDPERITKDEAWAVIRAYFDAHGLVDQQLSSFNRFLQSNVMDTIAHFGRHDIKYDPQFIPVSLKLTPRQERRSEGHRAQSRVPTGTRELSS